MHIQNIATTIVKHFFHSIWITRTINRYNKVMQHCMLLRWKLILPLLLVQRFQKVTLQVHKKTFQFYKIFGWHNIISLLQRSLWFLRSLMSFPGLKLTKMVRWWVPVHRVRRYYISLLFCWFFGRVCLKPSPLLGFACEINYYYYCNGGFYQKRLEYYFDRELFSSYGYGLYEQGYCSLGFA